MSKPNRITIITQHVCLEAIINTSRKDKHYKILWIRNQTEKRKEKIWMRTAQYFIFLIKPKYFFG
jgi:hypothetical protein